MTTHHTARPRRRSRRRVARSRDEARPFGRAGGVRRSSARRWATRMRRPRARRRSSARPSRSIFRDFHREFGDVELPIPPREPPRDPRPSTDSAEPWCSFSIRTSCRSSCAIGESAPCSRGLSTESTFGRPVRHGHYRGRNTCWDSPASLPGGRRKRALEQRQTARSAQLVPGAHPAVRQPAALEYAAVVSERNSGWASHCLRSMADRGDCPVGGRPNRDPRCRWVRGSRDRDREPLGRRLALRRGAYPLSSAIARRRWSSSRKGALCASFSSPAFVSTSARDMPAGGSVVHATSAIRIWFGSSRNTSRS